MLFVRVGKNAVWAAKVKKMPSPAGLRREHQNNSPGVWSSRTGRCCPAFAET